MASPGVSQTAVIIFTSVDPQQSTVGVTPTSLVANGFSTATISVTLKGQSGQALPNKTVQVNVSGLDNYINNQRATGLVSIGQTDANGHVTAVLTSTTTGPRTITAVGDDIPLNEQAVVTFTVGAVDADASTLTTDKTHVIADGADAAAVTVTLFDSYGHPVPGQNTLLLTSGSATLDQPQTTTAADGTVTATLRATDVQTVTITAVNLTENITLSQQAVITFVVGPIDAAQSAILVTPTSLIASGSHTATITATLRDSLGHIVANRAIRLNVTGGSGNVVSPSTVVTSDDQGHLHFSLTATGLGERTLSLTDLAYNQTIPAGVVEFVRGPLDVSAATLTANKTNLTADGTDEAILTATLYDSYGHPIPDQAVLIESSGIVTLSQAVTTSNSQGQVQAVVRSQTIQTVTVTAVIQPGGDYHDSYPYSATGCPQLYGGWS